MSGPNAALPQSGRDDVLKRCNVSRETLDRIEQVLGVLAQWRPRMNLMGPREWPDIWTRHVEDSLQLLPHLGSREVRLLDMGSGAGFPGLILAAALKGRGEVTLVESVGKKAAFLAAAAQAAGLPARVEAQRVEALAPFPVTHVTARALAPLPKLLDLAAPWLATGATGLFLKGKTWAEELTLAQERWTFACDTIPSRTDESGAILKLTEVRRAT